MLTRQAWLVPTLVAPLAVIEAAKAGAALPEAVVTKAIEVAGVHEESFRRAAAAGVRIAMGTDSGVGPHGRNLEELAIMQRCGLSAEQALHAATASAAQLCGLGEDVGRLAPGFVADLVVVRGGIDELATLGDRIREVWQAGALAVDRRAG
jgi:imidazolonepropionase-like amidohydrolase